MPIRTLMALPVLLLSAGAHGFSSGPDPDRVALCGAGPSCANSGCHDSEPVNSSDTVSQLLLANGDPLPAAYTADELLELALEVSDPDFTRSRFGMQLAAVTGCPFGTQVGGLESLEPGRSQVVESSGVQFLEHRCGPPFDFDNCGYVPSAGGQNRWLFRWQAPAGYQGAVTFYWAINAANGDATSDGDFISLWELTLPPACPRRIADLRLVKADCDPLQPGAPRVLLRWAAEQSGEHRLYATQDPLALSDPGGSGASLLESACVERGPTPVLELLTVVGVCLDGSDGPV